MPYSEKQEKFFRAVAHGMKPRKGKLSRQKAKELLSHEGTTDEQHAALAKRKRRK